jgi:hypothetical protein
MKPCAIHWCDALATRGDYCAIHAVAPNYDPRNDYEREIDRRRGVATGERLRPPVRPKSRALPVDERPLIVRAEE